MSRKKAFFKTVSIVLSLLLLLTLCPLGVSAADTVTVTPVAETRDVTLEATDNTKDMRVRTEEGAGLNTIVIDNGDGTHTMTLYDHPVKYVDEKGDVQDISLEIASAADGSYKTKANDIQTVFPKKISDGITLSGNGVSVKLTPGSGGSSRLSGTELRTAEDVGPYISGISADSTVTKLDSETVSYYYDNRTTLEYSLTYTGFKEDIVVSEYTGQTEYHFLLETGGLTLTKIDESYYLTDAEGNIKATLGDIIIFTADERNNALGSMTHTTVREDQQYIVTIHIDAEYLKDEKTKYPIRIDPTIEITYDGNGASAIQDVTLNQNSGSSGTSGSLYVGKRNTYGISRTLMKFPGLNLNSIPSNCTIDSAYIEIRDLMCETTAMTVNAAMFMGNDWDESTANWSNTNPNLYTPISGGSVSVSYSNGTAVSPNHRYSINITKAVRLWKSGFYPHAKGIILKADDSVENGSSALYKTFASYNRASLKPSLKINYTSNVTHTAYGWLGFVNSSVINGWVWCSNHPSETLDVVLTITNTDTNQSWRTVGPASIYRSDVKDAGYGTGYYGFSCSMGDWASFPHGYYSVSAVAILPSGGTYTLHASPKTYFNDTLHLDYPEGCGDYLLVNQQMNLQYTGYSGGTHTVEWLTSNGNIASIVPATKAVKGKAVGTAVITVRITDSATGRVLESSKVIHVRDDIGIVDNAAYYIMNSNSRQFLSVSGASVCAANRAVAYANKWLVTIQEDEKYNLQNGYSMSSNTLNASGLDLVVSSNSSSTNLIGTEDFTIYRSIDEGYEGLYCIRYQNYYVTQGTNGIKLTTELTNGSYWSFMNAEKGKAVMATTYTASTGFDAGIYNTEFQSTFNSLGYQATAQNNMTASEFYGYMDEVSIIANIVHSNSGVMHFETAAQDSLGWVIANRDITNNNEFGVNTSNSYWIEGSTNAYFLNDLASLRCAMYLGCSSGGNAVVPNYGTYNLLDATYGKGAHFVMGMTHTVPLDRVLDFTNYFYSYIALTGADEMNLIECIQSAVTDAGYYLQPKENETDPDVYGFLPYDFRGDGYQYLRY